MDFLARTKADNTADADAEKVRIITRQQELEEIIAVRARIVDKRIKEFAAAEGYEAQELPRTASVRYYLIGGLVFTVRLFGNLDKSGLVSIVPNTVRWQHSVALMGVDITERPQEVGRGSLALLSYEGVRRTLTTHSDLEFGYEVVVKALFPAIELD